MDKPSIVILKLGGLKILSNKQTNKIYLFILLACWSSCCSFSYANTLHFVILFLRIHHVCFSFLLLSFNGIFIDYILEWNKFLWQKVMNKLAISWLTNRIVLASIMQIQLDISGSLKIPEQVHLKAIETAWQQFWTVTVFCRDCRRDLRFKALSSGQTKN